jgi:hypothetical protein
VFADAPGATKRPLEVVDELPPKRVSRRSATEVSATNHEDTPLRNHHRSSTQMDEGSQSMDEGSIMCRAPSPTASAGRGHEHFDSDGFLDPEVEFSDASQFSFGQLSTLSSAFVIFLDSFGCVMFFDMIFVFMLFRCNCTTVVKRKRKGKGLDKITQGLGAKVTIEIPKGMKHPEKPLSATKFVSKGGLIARGQMPVFPHFKEYKKDKNMLTNFIGKVRVIFLITS